MLNICVIKTPTSLWMDLIDTWSRNHLWRPVLIIGDFKSSSRAELLKALKDRYASLECVEMQALQSGSIPDYIISGDRVVPSLDEPILQMLARNETVFFKMIEHRIYRFDNVRYEELRAYMMALARVWLAMIKKSKIDIVLCPTIPHRGSDYVGYLVAKHLGKKFLFMCSTTDLWIGCTGKREVCYFPSDDLGERSGRLVEKLGRQPEGNESSFPSELEKYLQIVGGVDYRKAKPSYLREKEEESRGKEWKDMIPWWGRLLYLLLKKDFGKIRSNSLNRMSINSHGHVDLVSAPKARIAGLAAVGRAEKARKWYSHNCRASRDILGREYVLFAAQFEPERTVCPDAGYLFDLVRVLKLIREGIPADWKIVYKEHPSNFRSPIRYDNNRTIARYKEILSGVSDVWFLDWREDQFRAIDGARAVMTQTGTAAWEARVRGIPSVIFGDAWYKGCPGIASANTSLDVCRWVEQLRTGNVDLTVESLRQYLSSLSTNLLQIDSIYKRPKNAKHLFLTSPVSYQKKVDEIARAYASAAEGY